MDATLDAVFDRALHPRRLSPADLPALDLYMDQIVTLLEDNCPPVPGEKPLTKAMINNYSKEGLIKPVKGKKYSREHILQMLVIHSLKGTLRIGEIKRTLQETYALEGFDGERLSICYQRALDCETQQTETLSKLLRGVAASAGADSGDPEGVLSAVIALSALSQSLEASAIGLIDAFFPTPAIPKKH